MSSTSPPILDTPAAAPAPVAADERIIVLDVLRGFAIFGILIVNMTVFAMPYASYWLDKPWWPTWPDRLAMALIDIFAVGKFYLLFSLLFGVGLALQMQRIKIGFALIYARRLLVLFVFGLCHILFFWWGDILATYAVLGFVPLLLRRQRTLTLLILAAAVYALPIAGDLAYVIPAEAARSDPAVVAREKEDHPYQQEWRADQTEAAIAVYRHGTWDAILHYRLHEYAQSFIALLFMVPGILAMFLLGLVVGRHCVLHDPQRYRRLLIGLAAVALPIGLALNVAWTIARESVSPTDITWRATFGFWLYVLGTPLLTFGYAATIVLLWQRATWASRLRPLAAVGRTALSNYLLQTLICTTLFYSYGLGWYGYIGPAWGLVLTVAIFAVQLPLSAAWLRHFRFGPLEWVWRCLTYGRWQPLWRPPAGLPPPTQGLIT